MRYLCMRFNMRYMLKSTKHEAISSTMSAFIAFITFSAMTFITFIDSQMGSPW